MRQGKEEEEEEQARRGLAGRERRGKAVGPSRVRMEGEELERRKRK